MMKQKFITIGEIMLRLTPPDYELIKKTDIFTAVYGGSEANVAVSLANLGIDTSFFTVVPDNSLGYAAIRMMRSNHVNCDAVIFSTTEETPTHRLGTYYLESGYGIRAGRVIYDRKYSAFSEYDFSRTKLEEILQNYTWLHLSGITPALGQTCRNMILTCLQIAKRKNMVISFDGNFRSALWSWEEARDFCTQCLPYIDVLFGIEPYHIWRDPREHSFGDVKDELVQFPNFKQQEEVFRAFVKNYPNIKCIARHVRYMYNSAENGLKGYLWLNGKTYESRKLSFPVLDRVGGGDAFVSGIIYALMNKYKPEAVIHFGVAASALKHTIYGDGNVIDDISVIQNVMEEKFDIKR